jgi:hypothetical protein
MGGCAGDILYALAAVKMAGGGEFYCNSGCNAGWRLPDATYASVLSLIDAQPYISRTGIVPEARGIDLDVWRQRPGKALNISDQIAEFLGTEYIPRNDPWLYVAPHPVAPVVLHRSPRYHVAGFPWRRVLATYREAVFVGYLFEYEQFAGEFGHVPFYPTHNYLELAEVIAGCELFIGNQSSPAAIAQGLRVNMVQESFPPGGWPGDCVWERAGMTHGYGEQVELPYSLGMVNSGYSK